MLVAVATLSAFRATCGDPGDMNHDGLIDGRDVQLFVEAAVGDYDPCADVAGYDGEIESADVQAMATLLLAAP